MQESLKQLFQVELEEARRLLDETANQKAQLELEKGRDMDTINQLREQIASNEAEIERLLQVKLRENMFSKRRRIGRSPY